MGQYYHPTLLGKRYGLLGWLSPHKYGNGMKLMEHSYMGNRFVNVVLNQIHNNPTRIAWIGDYADSPYDENNPEPYMAKLSLDRFMEFFQKVHGEKSDAYKISPEEVMPFDGPDDFRGWYLINHTQQSFLDLGKYAEENSWEEKFNSITQKWAVHPLPLLTACGNGRGGGDYHDCFPDYDKVGTWAFDVIELTDCLPVGLKEEHYCFTEQMESADREAL